MASSTVSGPATYFGNYHFLSQKPATQSKEYIKAWKGAADLELPCTERGQAMLHGLVHGYYSLDDVAMCEYGNHPTEKCPALGCACGFYGVTYDRWKDICDEYSTRIIMEVEFYGKVIKHTMGWRAEKQRVLGMYLNDSMVHSLVHQIEDGDKMTTEMLLATTSNITKVEVRLFKDLL